MNDNSIIFGSMGLIIALFYLVIFSIAMLVMAFWIWMIIDCATNEPNEGNDKIVWILVVILAGWLGAAIYYFARRPERKRKFDK